MLFNFDPPVTAEEVRAASLQYVRKISGFNKPSKANEAAFLAAVDDVAAISTPASVFTRNEFDPQKPRRRGSKSQGSQCGEISGVRLPRSSSLRGFHQR